MYTRARQFRRLRLPILLLVLAVAVVALPGLTTAPASVPLAAQAMLPAKASANT